MKTLTRTETDYLLNQLNEAKKILKNIESFLSVEQLSISELYEIYRNNEKHFEKIGKIEQSEMETKEEFARIFEMMNYVDEFDGIPSTEEIVKARNKSLEK